MSFKKSMYTISTLAKINTKRFFRDKVAIFFSIGFPVIFLLIFGFLNSNSDISFNIALINQSNTAFSKQFVSQLQKSTFLKINKDLINQSQATTAMENSQIDATIVLPKDFGKFKDDQPIPTGTINILYTNNSEQAGKTIENVLRSQLASLNTQLTKQTVPLSVSSSQINQKSASAFDFTFAGILGFAIVGLGIFGPINVFPELKKMGILRRLSTTPLRVWQYFLSIMTGQAVIGIISLSIMFLVGIGLFNLKIAGNIALLIGFLVLSILMILGIGLAIGGWAKNERQAAPLANLIVFPMLFLGGSFFPRYAMPEWLQSITTFLPLTPVIDGTRLIIANGAGLLTIAPQIGLIAGWMAVIYLIAFKLFRWE